MSEQVRFIRKRGRIIPIRKTLNKSDKGTSDRIKTVAKYAAGAAGIGASYLVGRKLFRIGKKLQLGKNLQPTSGRDLFRKESVRRSYGKSYDNFDHTIELRPGESFLSNIGYKMRAKTTDDGVAFGILFKKGSQKNISSSVSSGRSLKTLKGNSHFDKTFKQSIGARNSNFRIDFKARATATDDSFGLGFSVKRSKVDLLKGPNKEISLKNLLKGLKKDDSFGLGFSVKRSKVDLLKGPNKKISKKSP